MPGYFVRQKAGPFLVNPPSRNFAHNGVMVRSRRRINGISEGHASPRRRIFVILLVNAKVRRASQDA